jgi:hypothetical protein
VDDADLKNKMLFEADLLEREGGTQVRICTFVLVKQVK